MTFNNGCNPECDGSRFNYFYQQKLLLMIDGCSKCWPTCKHSCGKKRICKLTTFYLQNELLQPERCIVQRPKRPNRAWLYGKIMDGTVRACVWRHSLVSKMGRFCSSSNNCDNNNKPHTIGSKVDGRVLSREDQSLDFCHMEASRTLCTESKLQHDKAKLAIETKCFLDSILLKCSYSAINKSPALPNIQIFGFKSRVHMLVLMYASSGAYKIGHSINRWDTQCWAVYIFGTTHWQITPCPFFSLSVCLQNESIDGCPALQQATAQTPS